VKRSRRGQKIQDLSACSPSTVSGAHPLVPSIGSSTQWRPSAPPSDRPLSIATTTSSCVSGFAPLSVLSPLIVSLTNSVIRASIGAASSPWRSSESCRDAQWTDGFDDRLGKKLWVNKPQVRSDLPGALAREKCCWKVWSSLLLKKCSWLAEPEYVLALDSSYLMLKDRHRNFSKRHCQMLGPCPVSTPDSKSDLLVPGLVFRRTSTKPFIAQFGLESRARSAYSLPTPESHARTKCTP
jgi:hypothetical protein